MPFLIPAIAAVASAIATAAFTVGTFVAVAVGASGLSALALGATIGGVLLAGVATLAISAALSAVGSLFAPSPKLNFNPVTFKADINSGLPYVIGRTGVGGNIVFADTSNDGNNKWLHYIIALSIGAVTSIDTFTANNVPVTFDAGSGAATSLGYNFRGLYDSGTSYNINDGVGFMGSIYICSAPEPGGYDPSNPDYWLPAGTYAGPRWISKMWQTRSLGTQPSAALLEPPGTGDVPEWTSVNQLSGIAAARWVLQADQGAYPTGTPAPIWVVRGMPVYDPRLDGTYPGGAGPQRAADPTTWAFSENPYLHALQWCLGQTNNGQRTIGLGAPISAIDVPAFVNGANVADANGWKVGGQVASTDSKWDILVSILQAGCGAPMRLGAKISCLVQTPRVSIATLTGADFSGAVSVQAMAPRKQRFNRVIPTYRSEAHGWAMVPADAIQVSDYVVADGGQRTKGFNTPLIQQVKQAGQWARYAIEDSREFGPIAGPLMPQWIGLQPGDCVTIDEPEYGLNGQDVLIMDRKVDPASSISTITCRSETAAKHPFALGQVTTAPPAPALTGLDLVSAAPNSPPWMAVGTTNTSGGVSTAAIVVTGTMENAAATNLIIRTRVSAGPGPWEHFSSPPAPVADRTVIDSLGSDEVRDIELSYLVRGIQGLPLIIYNVTAGAAVASGATPSTTLAAIDWTDVTASGPATLTAPTNTQTISGITAPVTLTVTFTGPAALAYSQNGAAGVAIVSGGTIVVGNGDTLIFWPSATAVGANAGTVTVVNTTAGGAAVDTFNYALTVTTTLADTTPLFTSSAPGAFSFPIPADAPGFVDIEIWAGGGGGGHGVSGAEPAVGLGGGGGGYVKKHIAVIPGTTVIAGVVGAGGASAANGAATTVTTPAMTAGGGGKGTTYGAGAGGAAAGGDIDTAGNAGALSDDWDGGSAGNGSGDQVHLAVAGTAPGGGGAGATGPASGAGANGQVVITARTS